MTSAFVPPPLVPLSGFGPHDGPADNLLFPFNLLFTEACAFSLGTLCSLLSDPLTATIFVLLYFLPLNAPLSLLSPSFLSFRDFHDFFYFIYGHGNSAPVAFWSSNFNNAVVLLQHTSHRYIALIHNNVHLINIEMRYLCRSSCRSPMGAQKWRHRTNRHKWEC